MTEIKNTTKQNKKQIAKSQTGSGGGANTFNTQIQTNKNEKMRRKR
jgi:hypothetical protein